MRDLDRTFMALSLLAATAAPAAAMTLDFSFWGLSTTSGAITSVYGPVNGDTSTRPVDHVVYDCTPGAYADHSGMIEFVSFLKVYFTHTGIATATDLAGTVRFFADEAHTVPLIGSGNITHTSAPASGPGGIFDLAGQFHGEYQTVPEPAGMAALGLGAAFLRRRRARSPFVP